MLTYVDDEPYRRDIKAIRNLQEGRHDLAKHVFHGRKGELRHRYQAGMEDRLGALGLVLNRITLWNTVYLDTALDQPRAQGYPVFEDDVVRLSPLMRKHINVHGHYYFRLPDLRGGHRETDEVTTGRGAITSSSLLWVSARLCRRYLPGAMPYSRLKAVAKANSEV